MIRLFFISLITLLIISCNSEHHTNPNIILIMADDLGYETIGANGGTSYHTPHLDQMAKEGMRFEHCYAQPLCTPSRIQIMTGIYNVRNYVRFGLLDTSQTTFAHLFKESGYNTCIIGKWQLGADSLSPYWAGFDEYALWQVTPGAADSSGRDHRYSKPMIRTNGMRRRYDKGDYGPDIVSDYGIDFIERSVQNDQPFLLYYPMILTHCPFSPTPDSPEWLTDDTTVMKYKGKAHYFEDMVTYMDKIVGHMRNKLKELEISDNTLLIFTGDNGTDRPVVSEFQGREVAGAKNKTTDAGTRVPLIVEWPGTVPGGMVSNDLIDLTDFLPTFCDVSNLSIPAVPAIDGRSFGPQLQGKEGNPRDWIYCWYSRNGIDSLAQVFVRNQVYKLYADGRFYDIESDPLEESPMNTNNLNTELGNLKDRFQNIIEDYHSKRLELIN